MPLIRKTTQAPPPPPPPSDALRHGTAAERWSAARDMMAPEHAAALGAALAVEQDANVREAILTSLCRIATPDAAGAIAPLVRSDDAQTRRAALDALRSMPGAAAPHMPSLLLDEDPDVRLLSCEIARELPAEEATELLAALLLRETEANVCASAIDVLTEVGTSAALPALQDVVRRFADEPFLKFAAEAAVERISASTDTSRG